MINVGIAGLGFMGMIHFLCYQKVKGAKVLALCEQDPVKLSGDWRGIKGNFGPPGQMMDLAKYTRTSDLKELLADERIDMIDICLPPGAHAEIAIAALKAGKHVFCEKPIALSPTDAKRMVKTARNAGKLLMIGHVLPFFPEYAFAYKAIEGGKYGRLLGAQFKRVISDPKWLTGYYDPKKVGGPMLDLHIHDAHFIRLVCGMPRAVFTTGRMRGEVAELFTSQFLFADDSLSVSATSGVVQQQGRAFTHAYEIQLEKATLLFDFSVIGDKPELTMPVTVLTADGKVTRPTLGSGDPLDSFAAELTEATKCVRSGKESPVLGGQLACDAVELCQKETESLRKRRLVNI